jgi:tetratricopeptide (TPR) repeat protein
MLPADEPPPPILPLHVLAPMLAVCLGGSWLMVPKKGELIERLFKDKQYERVVAVLQDDLHGMKSGEIGGLRHLSATQLGAISRLLNLTPREQLHAVFAPKNAPEYDAYIHNIVLTAVRYVDVLPPQEAYETIAPYAQRVPEQYRLPLLLTVAHNAHAISRPDLAANALSLASQCTTAGWDVAREMAQSYRWSGQPATAARRLRAWLSSHRSGLDAAQQDEARDLSFSLALESGKPGEAFDICLLELSDATAEGSVPPDLVDKSLSLALQSSRTKEMLPWLERVIGAMPETKLPLADLRRLHSAEPERFAPYIRWATPFSRWSDWNSEFDAAFDTHLRLALLGDVQSRDRCVAIYDYLGRTEECCEMLLLLGEVKDRPELTLLAARQLAEIGRDDEAKTLFETWLKKHPQDRQAHFDVASLREDMGDEPGSRRAFEEMVKLFPGDAPAMKRLATACIRDADYTTALTLYEKLPEDAHDIGTLENYAMIAESLDDHESELRALQLTLKKTPNPTVELFLDLAETASYLPEGETAVEILREALQIIPDSAQLRIALATQFLNREQPEEALRMLTHESLRHNYDAVQVILGMSESIGDARRALAFLGDDVETRFPFSNENHLQLAVLHYNAGEASEAERLFASVPETPANFQILAEARFETGQGEESARLMTAHLQAHPKSSPDDWLFLGDIYEQLGRVEEARKAYDYSLALLTADLPDTAAIKPAGAQ